MNLNMNEVIGKADLLMITLDTLRYDVAEAEYLAGNLPNLCGNGAFEKRHSPGNYTYAAHHSFFIGYFPTPIEYQPLHQREWLFLSSQSGLRKMKEQTAFVYQGSNLVEGLRRVGYKTICIGGVVFFSKVNELCSVFPKMFEKSYWRPGFGVTNLHSTEAQVELALQLLQKLPVSQRVFLFLNVAAIHGPNYYYLEEYRKQENAYNPNKNILASELDSVTSQRAALRYVDQSLKPLFDYLRERNRTFCIALSDHGTCYGEDGYQGHYLSHEQVYTVPYRHFFL